MECLQQTFERLMQKPDVYGRQISPLLPTMKLEAEKNYNKKKTYHHYKCKVAVVKFGAETLEYKRYQGVTGLPGRHQILF